MEFTRRNINKDLTMYVVTHHIRNIAHLILTSWLSIETTYESYDGMVHRSLRLQTQNKSFSMNLMVLYPF